jgi:hypothetical protein
VRTNKFSEIEPSLQAAKDRSKIKKTKAGSKSSRWGNTLENLNLKNNQKSKLLAKFRC